MTPPSDDPPLDRAPPTLGIDPFVRAALVLAAAFAVAALAAFAAGSATFDGPAIRQALVGGLIAAAATAAGALAVPMRRAPSARTQAGMLGFGAGVMLAATSFSLLVPGMEAAREQGWGPWSGTLLVAAGLLGGAAALMAIERRIPHAHPFIGPHGDAPQSRRLVLFVLAIIVHNVPEGLAIGVAAVVDPGAVTSGVATGIAIQDVPEGLVVALALRTAGFPVARAAAVGALSGLVEPLAAVFGAIAVGWSAALLPWGLAAAAGAMLFVVSHEIIPESHRQGHEQVATGGLLAGFAMMMVLDSALG
ncbi:MAG TPA: ZIP family metal transporter [Burkholderiaceae bacterium]|nr:ZIP family metal transporter [Burkholderiaceae bacterium]